MDTKKSLRSAALLVLTAAIWGAAFVAQSAGMDYIGPFTFGGLRTLLGAVVLVPVAWAMHRGGKPVPWKKTLIGGAVSGVVFFAATSLQQVGIQYTTAGKAGFITALYVVLVPLCGLALGKKPGALVWAGVALACAGLYLLCVTDGFSLGAATRSCSGARSASRRTFSSSTASPPTPTALCSRSCSSPSRARCRAS